MGEAAASEIIDTGRDDALAATKLFPNMGLYPAVKAFAAAHPRAIQYLEQAPVLALGAMMGGPGVRRLNALYIAHKIGPLCEAGAPLKQVMRAFGLSPPLRRLTASSLYPSAGPIIARISGLDPALVGRVIPATGGLQARWLQACSAWVEHFRQRGASDCHFAWAAERLAQGRVRPRDASTVADFIIAGEPFSLAWQWPRALEEADRWHARLNGQRALGNHVIKPETVIDLGGHPDSVEAGGFTFVALRTVNDLAAEGRALRHCVLSYASQVLQGRSHIISIRKGDKRLATLELDADWTVRQLRGPCNALPRGDVATAASRYAWDCRKAAGHASTLGGAR